jgi:hypothetical protein
MGNLKHKPATRRDRVDAARLQKAGQHGDTILAHINPQEAGLLDWLADQKIDAPRNPKTGLLSFGMSDGESGRSGGDANPGGVGGGPAGGQTGGGIGGNTDDGTGGRSGGYGDQGYSGSRNQKAAEELGNYYRDTYINGMVNNPYAPKDTWMRAFQEAIYGPPPGAPGRASPPTGTNMGWARQGMSMLAGPAGPAISGLMSVGSAFGRAQSPAAQAASMAEQAATGARNSTGRDTVGSSAGATPVAADAVAPLADPKGAIPEGYTLNPAGQLVPLPGRGRRGVPDPLKNLLYDYILGGRSGGFSW